MQIVYQIRCMSNSRNWLRAEWIMTPHDTYLASLRNHIKTEHFPISGPIRYSPEHASQRPLWKSRNLDTLRPISQLFPPETRPHPRAGSTTFHWERPTCYRCQCSTRKIPELAGSCDWREEDTRSGNTRRVLTPSGISNSKMTILTIVCIPDIRLFGLLVHSLRMESWLHWSWMRRMPRYASHASQRRWVTGTNIPH